MIKGLITIWVKQGLCTFSIIRRILGWDSYEWNMTGSIRKKIEDESKYLDYLRWGQASDIGWNKLFKAGLTKLYDQWLSKGSVNLPKMEIRSPLPRKE